MLSVDRLKVSHVSGVPEPWFSYIHPSRLLPHIGTNLSVVYLRLARDDVSERGLVQRELCIIIHTMTKSL